MKTIQKQQMNLLKRLLIQQKVMQKLKKLSDDMICAFNDALIDDCMQVYKLYLNKKKTQ